MNFESVLRGKTPLLFLLSILFLTGCNKLIAVPQNSQNYGSMFLVNETGQTIPLNVSNEYRNITMLEKGFTKGTTFVPDVLVMNESGLYKIDWSISFFGGNNNLYGLSVGVNGVRQLPCYTHRTTTSNGVGNVGATCILNLSQYDEVSLLIADEAAPPSDVTVFMANLALLEVDK